MEEVIKSGFECKHIFTAVPEEGEKFFPLMTQSAEKLLAASDVLAYRERNKHISFESSQKTLRWARKAFSAYNKKRNSFSQLLNKSQEEEQYCSELEKYGKEVTRTKKSALKFLRDLGIIDEEGNLTKEYSL